MFSMSLQEGDISNKSQTSLLQSVFKLSVSFLANSLKALFNSLGSITMKFLGVLSTHSSNIPSNLGTQSIRMVRNTSASFCPFRQYLQAQQTRQKYRRACLQFQSSSTLIALKLEVMTLFWVFHSLELRRWQTKTSQSQLRQNFFSTTFRMLCTGYWRRQGCAALTIRVRNVWVQKEQDSVNWSWRRQYQCRSNSAVFCTVATLSLDLVLRLLI